MRAYVITGELNDWDSSPEVVGVVSSKRLAIDACETYLNARLTKGQIKWPMQNKHDGHAERGDYTSTYKMFFVNNADKELEE